MEEGGLVPPLGLQHHEAITELSDVLQHLLTPAFERALPAQTLGKPSPSTRSSGRHLTPCLADLFLDHPHDPLLLWFRQCLDRVQHGLKHLIHDRSPANAAHSSK